MLARLPRRFFQALILTATVAMPAAAYDGPLFRLEGFDYSVDDLSPALRQALYEAEQQHYQAIQAVADEALFELYVRQEAERREVDADQLTATLLAVDPPSESEIEAFYEANKSRIPAPLNQVRERIVGFLSEQASQVEKKRLVEEIKAKQTFQLLTRTPIPPRVEIVTRDYPFKGPADAQVTVVEYADFQCPHCKHASSVLASIVARYGEKVRLVYKDYPVNRSGISRLVAQGGVCADLQGRFWEYHDLAFERQSQLTAESPVSLATALGLDMAAFERCFQDPASADKIARSEAEARRLGVSGTPTLFVNGRRLVIEDLEQDVSRAIERALDVQG